MPNGETFEVPAESRVSDEVASSLRPMLATIARRSDALYRRIQPVAENYFVHGNGTRPITFASDSFRGKPEDAGILRLTPGDYSVYKHDFLFITKDEDGNIAVVRDYKIEANESHHVEVLASPAAGRDGYDYGDFAVSIFKRIWNGGQQGRVENEDYDYTDGFTRAQLEGVRGAVGASETLANRRYRWLVQNNARTS